MRGRSGALSDLLFTGGLYAGLGPYTLINLVGGADGEPSETLALRYSLLLPDQTYADEVSEQPRTDSWLGPYDVAAAAS